MQHLFGETDRQKRKREGETVRQTDKQKERKNERKRETDKTKERESADRDRKKEGFKSLSLKLLTSWCNWLAQNSKVIFDELGSKKLVFQVLTKTH